MSEAKMTLETPHLDYINSNKIDVEKSKLATPSLRRAITKFETTKSKWDELEDSEPLKKQWKTKLEANSKSILSDLKDIFPDEETKKAAEAKAAEEKAAADKAAAEKAEKEKSESKSDEEKTAEEKAAADKAAAEKAEKGSETENDEKKAETIINSLWKEKSKNGVLEITEDELSEKGFNCWTYLGFTKGEFAGYLFKSALFSETWTITKVKDKKKEEEAV